MLRDGREDTLRDLIVQIPFNRSGAEESALAAKYELPPLPPTAFDRFRRDLSKMFAPGDGSDGKIIAATRVWKELPAAEQQKAIGEYKAAVKVFGEQMVVWMSGMISSGREDILKKLLKPVVARPTTTSVKKDTAVLNDIPSTPLDVPDQLHDDPSKKHSYDVILPKLNESLRTEKELDTLKMPTPPLSPSERYTREALEKKWINFSDHHVARRAWLRLPLLHKRKYMDAYEVDLQIYRNKMAEWGAEMEASGKEAILKAVNVFANPVGGRRKGQTNERTVHGCDLFIKDSLMHLAEDDSNAHGQFDSAISTDEMAKILLKWEELPAEKRLEYSAKATEAAAKGDIDEDAAALSLSLNIRHYMTRYKMLAIEYNMPEHPRMPFARYREEMMSDP
uniref:HMG box domain-containing protein n=1 Tax=Plectus sambesii TaxID=2011161 RepID=A0A914UH39_9BILA